MKNKSILFVVLAALSINLVGCASNKSNTESVIETTTTVPETTVVTTEPETILETTVPEPVPAPMDERDYFLWEDDKLVGLNSEGKELREVIIPSGVTEIGGARAGFKKSNCEKLFISNSVSIINDRAFQYCNNLKHVEFEEGCVIDSYNNWFESDHNIEFLDFPEGMTKINSSLNINSIKRITIPSTVTVLPECLFEFNFDIAERNNLLVTDKVEIFTTGDNVQVIGDFDNREYIDSLVNDKDNNRNAIDMLQKLLMPTMFSRASDCVPVVLHCDKDSLYERLFNDASWVTIEINPESLVDTEEETTTEDDEIEYLD